MDSPSKNRPAMIASVIRETIAPVLRECPPECGIVSMTDVEVSADFSYVTVLVSALREQEAALAFLEGRRGELQRSIGKQVSVRRTPKLRFRIDRRAEEGDRIDRLLQNVHQESPDDTSSGRQDQVR